LEKTFLEKKGIEVLDVMGLEIENSEEIGRKEPRESYKLVKELFYKHQEVDRIFISCTNFRIIEIIDKLEKDTNVPVVTSVQATLWKCLRTISCNDKIEGYGKLLQQ